MTNDQTSQLEKNKALALKFLEIYSSHDAEASIALMTPDAEFVMFGNHSRLDHNGIRVHLAKARRIIASVQKQIIKRVVAEGSHVVVEKELFATAANGNLYHGSYVFLVGIAGEKIANVCEYANLLAAIEAFGADQVGRDPVE